MLSLLWCVPLSLSRLNHYLLATEAHLFQTLPQRTVSPFNVNFYVPVEGLTVCHQSCYAASGINQRDLAYIGCMYRDGKFTN